jgi:formylglycine-generating enzyme required for sulfatase activity
MATSYLEKASAQSNGRPAKAKVFISYSRKDIAFADRIEAALKARGFAPAIDRSEIYAFEEWWKRIEALITSADTVVFVLSPDSVSSGVALKEVAFAASLNKRFAPIVYRRVEDNAVPEALSKFNFIFFDDEARFEERADRLAEALHTDIAWIRRHSEFGEQARDWALADRPKGLLLRSPLLEEAERWIASRPQGAPAPTAETQFFIQHSRRAETRRRRGRALVYLLLVGVVTGIIAWLNQSNLTWFLTVFPYMQLEIRDHVLTATREKALKPGDSFKECAKDCPEMVVVPAGEFLMGTPADEKGRAERGGEAPQHRVIISRPFAVSKYEVTRDEWDACVIYGDCPERGDFPRGRLPIINIAWEDAMIYVAWFSRMTQKNYRLLSEAEWEYAARSGTTTAYSWGNEVAQNNANCHGCGSQWDNKAVAPVGSFAPNPFGLHDMHGNVWEWVEDCIHLDYEGAPEDGSTWAGEGAVLEKFGRDCDWHMIRGGSYVSEPASLRSAHRDKGNSVYRDGSTGFRVGRTLTIFPSSEDR